MIGVDGSLALCGVRVLDFSRVLAGPWASQLLGDLGAEVIKIEKPGTGDDTRHWGPPWLSGKDCDAERESAYFLSANRNKKSVTLDISKPEGQQIARELAAQSDVLIENFKVGGLAKFGLDYESLRPLNPGLVYCSITGFGQDSPLAQRPGYDFMLQGMSGMMSITGSPDAADGGGPQKVGVALVDVLTGLYTAVGVLAGLQQRSKCGQGQYIDIALFDCAVACLANQALNYLTTASPPQRLGNAHPNIVPYQVFATSDGHIILAIGNDSQFHRFCSVVGRGDVSVDKRFSTNAQRVTHRDVLVELLGDILRQRSTDEWLSVLETAAIPCAPINSIEQAFAEPHAVARGLAMQLPHALGIDAPSVRNPLRMPGVRSRSSTAPPLLGQNTREVLTEMLGKSDDDLAALRLSSVI